MTQTQKKFRVWTGSAMEYDVMVGRFGAFYVNPGKNDDGLDENDNACLTTFNTIYPKEYPVMQFTGLLDRNGNEIFEGDICKRIIRLVGGTTKEELFDVRFGHQYAYHEDTCFLGYNIDGTGLDGEYEVVGNIYQNQELLPEPRTFEIA